MFADRPVVVAAKHEPGFFVVDRAIRIQSNIAPYILQGYITFRDHEVREYPLCILPTLLFRLVTVNRDDEDLCIFLFPGAYFPDEDGVDS